MGSLGRGAHPLPRPSSAPWDTVLFPARGDHMPCEHSGEWMAEVMFAVILSYLSGLANRETDPGQSHVSILMH